MRTEIYYFSGTGNSLYVAKELQKRIPESTLIPMVRLLNQKVIKAKAETVGFVFPVHLGTAPMPVRLFIEKLDLRSTKYLFTVATRGGTIHRAFVEIDNILKRKDKRLDSHFTLNFIDNNPRFPNYDVPTAEVIASIGTKAQTELDLIQNIILNRETSREKDVSFVTQLGVLYERLLPLFTFLAKHAGFNDDFYADANCFGCGICEEVCLAQKIVMISHKPTWKASVKCYSCRACLNYCPVQSVQIKDTRLAKSYTNQNGRYPHPFATAAEIAEQR